MGGSKGVLQARLLPPPVAHGAALPPGTLFRCSALLQAEYAKEQQALKDSLARQKDAQRKKLEERLAKKRKKNLEKKLGTGTAIPSSKAS